MEAPVATTLKREELFELVWKEPATKIAERYKIPYPDFKKICDNVEVPIPGSGYWSKLRAGKTVPCPALPKDYSGPEEVRLEARVIAKRKTSTAVSEQEATLAFQKSSKVPVK